MNILEFCFYKCLGYFNSSLALMASAVEAKELKNDWIHCEHPYVWSSMNVLEGLNQLTLETKPLKYMDWNHLMYLFLVRM